jgi:hypothetical protein
MPLSVDSSPECSIESPNQIELSYHVQGCGFGCSGKWHMERYLATWALRGWWLVKHCQMLVASGYFVDTYIVEGSKNEVSVNYHMVTGKVNHFSPASIQTIHLFHIQMNWWVLKAFHLLTTIRLKVAFTLGVNDSSNKSPNNTKLVIQDLNLFTMKIFY